jgi:predicted acylesterase/phospholipase RssA
LEVTVLILSVDGGGVRGMMTAKILLRLEKAVPGWTKKVDLFAGASTGAIIALALAKGLTPRQIATFYRVQLPKIFSQSWWRRFSGLLYAKYSNQALKEALGNILGQTTLGQLERDVLISTYFLGQKEPFQGARAKFYDKRDADVRIADLALWSGSAPTYLPSADGHVDGGLSANNCAVAAMAYQESRGTPLSQLRVFSLGTGRYPVVLDGGDKGLAYWGEKLLIPFVDGSVDVAHFQAYHFLKDEGNYHRLQPELPREIDLDDVTALDELIALADKVDIGPAVEWLTRQVAGAYP